MHELVAVCVGETFTSATSCLSPLLINMKKRELAPVVILVTVGTQNFNSFLLHVIA